jgi:hypothetical protein
MAGERGIVGGLISFKQNRPAVPAGRFCFFSRPCFCGLSGAFYVRFFFTSCAFDESTLLGRMTIIAEFSCAVNPPAWHFYWTQNRKIANWEQLPFIVARIGRLFFALTIFGHCIMRPSGGKTKSLALRPGTFRLEDCMLYEYF